MAVELEKIAAMLEQAYEDIENLENENSQLKAENSNLQAQMELQKEASTSNNWEDSNDLGSAVDYSFPENVSSEHKLDDFLAN